MNRDYIPGKDESYDSWQENFMTICSASATAWALGSLTALQAAQAIWAAAWALAKVKTTRNIGEVTAKNEARAAYEGLLRNFIQQYIMVNPLISNQDRDDLQVKPRETNHAPIPVPVTVPLLDFVPMTGCQMKVTFRQQADADGVSRRGRPDGVQFCEISVSRNVQPISPEDCTERKLLTRSPYVIQFGPNEAGQKVFMYARWVNPRGECGPYTEVHQFIIP